MLFQIASRGASFSRIATCICCIAIYRDRYETSVPQGGVYSACVKNWSLPAKTFPSGLKELSTALETPWLLYVPFWCPDNVFSDQFRWLESYNPAMPHLIFAEPHPDDALAFYRMLFDYGKRNGMAGYENVRRTVALLPQPCMDSICSGFS